MKVTAKHDCPQSPTLDYVVCDDEGNWAVMGTSITGGFFPSVRERKIDDLPDGRCPWCKANLAWLAEVWPHTCEKTGQGARELILKSTDLPKEVDLRVDSREPTRAIYTAIYEFYVKECPDCGLKLFE